MGLGERLVISSTKEDTFIGVANILNTPPVWKAEKCQYGAWREVSYHAHQGGYIYRSSQPYKFPTGKTSCKMSICAWIKVCYPDHQGGYIYRSSQHYKLPTGKTSCKMSICAWIKVSYHGHHGGYIYRSSQHYQFPLVKQAAKCQFVHGEKG